MPSWSPMKRQLLRSASVTWSRRGYHASGTEMVRPSLRSTASVSSVTCTVGIVPVSVSVKLRDGARYVFDLREDCVFDLRRKSHKGIERGDAADGRVQVFKQFVRDARGYFCAEAVRARVFVRDDDLVGAFDAFGNRVPVVRRERAQVEHFDVDALLLCRLACGDERTLHERAVGDNGKISAGAHCSSLAEGDHEVVRRISRLVVSLPVEMFVFEKEHGIV